MSKVTRQKTYLHSAKKAGVVRKIRNKVAPSRVTPASEFEFKHTRTNEPNLEKINGIFSRFYSFIDGDENGSNNLFDALNKIESDETLRHLFFEDINWRERFGFESSGTDLFIAALNHPNLDDQLADKAYRILYTVMTSDREVFSTEEDTESKSIQKKQIGKDSKAGLLSLLEYLKTGNKQFVFDMADETQMVYIEPTDDNGFFSEIKQAGTLGRALHDLAIASPIKKDMQRIIDNARFVSIEEVQQEEPGLIELYRRNPINTFTLKDITNTNNPNHTIRGTELGRIIGEKVLEPENRIKHKVARVSTVLGLPWETLHEIGVPKEDQAILYYTGENPTKEEIEQIISERRLTDKSFTVSSFARQMALPNVDNRVEAVFSMLEAYISLEAQIVEESDESLKANLEAQQAYIIEVFTKPGVIKQNPDLHERIKETLTSPQMVRRYGHIVAALGHVSNSKITELLHELNAKYNDAYPKDQAWFTSISGNQPEALEHREAITLQEKKDQEALLASTTSKLFGQNGSFTDDHDLLTKGFARLQGLDKRISESDYPGDKLAYNQAVRDNIQEKLQALADVEQTGIIKYPEGIREALKQYQNACEYLVNGNKWDPNKFGIGGMKHKNLADMEVILDVVLSQVKPAELFNEKGYQNYGDNFEIALKHNAKSFHKYLKKLSAKTSYLAGERVLAEIIRKEVKAAQEPGMPSEGYTLRHLAKKKPIPYVTAGMPDRANRVTDVVGAGNAIGNLLVEIEGSGYSKEEKLAALSIVSKELNIGLLGRNDFLKNTAIQEQALKQIARARSNELHSKQFEKYLELEDKLQNISDWKSEIAKVQREEAANLFNRILGDIFGKETTHEELLKTMSSHAEAAHKAAGAGDPDRVDLRELETYLGSRGLQEVVGSDRFSHDNQLSKGFFYSPSGFTSGFDFFMEIIDMLFDKLGIQN